MLLTRRGLFTSFGFFAASVAATSSYAFAVEPFRLRVKTYSFLPANWPAGLTLKIVALADVHASRPYMAPERVREICEEANRLSPDLIVLLGDYDIGDLALSTRVAPEEWAAALSILKAPLGVYAVLGNHDWYRVENGRRVRTVDANRAALENVGIPVLENHAIKLAKKEGAFWLAGLGDQVARADNLPATLEKIKDQDPVLLLAHEPDIFPKVPSRVALTLSGHTHGGQVRLLGYSPVVPSKFANRYAYGHIIERRGKRGERHLLVSGGLGCSGVPVRFGVPPEITVAELGGETDRARLA